MFTFDIEVSSILPQTCFLGTTKFAEFKPEQKLLKVGLRLNTSFKVLTDYEDAEWEVSNCDPRTK